LQPVPGPGVPPPLWGAIRQEEKQRLLSAEQMFIKIRRLAHLEREKEPLHALTVDWSRIAECFLHRTLNGHDGLASTGQTLGQLIRNMRPRAHELESARRQRMLSALALLNELDEINKKAGKHMGGVVLTWGHITHVHAGLYWALKAVLDEGHRSKPDLKH
jgi:hypothetical protein